MLKNSDIPISFWHENKSVVLAAAVIIATSDWQRRKRTSVYKISYHARTLVQLMGIKVVLLLKSLSRTSLVCFKLVLLVRWGPFFSLIINWSIILNLVCLIVQVNFKGLP